MLGSGIQSDPYIIQTITDLNNVRNNLSAYYKLGNDIDASATSTWDSGAGFVPIGTEGTPFIGNFNGDGYGITGLYINRGSTNYIGFFGKIQNASISNIYLSNVSYTGNDYIGALVGIANNSTISKCYCSGSITGSWYCGGLIGWSTGTNGCNIDNSYSLCSVTSSHTPDANAGGFIGVTYKGSVVNCYSSGLVTTTATSATGGFIGLSNTTTFTSSYWDTETSGKTTSAGGTGLTTIQMKTQSSYTGWDFVNVWTMPANNYPNLINPNVNSNPIANSDNVSVNKNGTVLINVLDNDTDANGDTLAISSFTQGSNGVVTQEGDNLRYTPNIGFSGSDIFTYTISDNNGGSATGTVNITVNLVSNTGYRILTIPVPQEGTIVSTQVNWISTTPSGTSIVIEVSTDNGNTWTQITNGSSIPGFSVGASLVGKSLQIKQTLNTTDITITPQLHSFEAIINYEVATISVGTILYLYKDSNNYLRFFYDEIGTNFILEKSVNGAIRTIGSPSVSITAGQPIFYSIKQTQDGSMIAHTGVNGTLTKWGDL